MAGLLIGLVVTLMVGRYVFKGYPATGVLMTGGLALLLASVLLGHPLLPPDKAGASGFTDIVVFVADLLSSRAAELGLMVMVLVGFAHYMTHTGANAMVVRLAARPLSRIRSPYVLVVAGYFAACLMSLAVSSATGLGVLLMATLFPLMVNMGVSRGAATAVCASAVAVILSPTSGDVVVAAEAAGMPLIDFAFRITLPISIAAIVAMGATHFFWQRYLDRHEHSEGHALEVGDEIEARVPHFYALLPFTPIIGVLLFDGRMLPKLGVVAILLVCILFTALVEFARLRDARAVFSGVEVVYQGMGEAFTGVVMLIVAAGVFAHGLTSVGFISALLGFVQGAGSGAGVLLLALVAITTLAAVTTGSGNAAFYAFVELIPKLALHAGVNPAFLVIPMLQASNLGRTVSPVAGVIVACSGMARLSPFELVKRTSLPCAVGLLVVVAGTWLMVPA